MSDNKPEPRPPTVFCPFCGSTLLKFASGTRRCGDCRAVFNVSFNRWLRKTPHWKAGHP